MSASGAVAEFLAPNAIAAFDAGAVAVAETQQELAAATAARGQRHLAMYRRWRLRADLATLAALAVDRQQTPAALQQPLCGRLSVQLGGQIEHAAAAGTRNAGQSRMVGALRRVHHLNARALAIGGDQIRLGIAEIAQAIADDQHLIDIAHRAQFDRPVAAAAIQRQRRDCVQQLAGIAITDIEAQGRIGVVAEGHQPHLDIPQRALNHAGT